MDPACPICSKLKNEERSFYKFAAPQYDNPLPEIVKLLQPIPGVRGELDDKNLVRVCPDCAQFYRYQVSYEYLVNGSEDEELLTRMSEPQAQDFCQLRIRDLEQLRREIDGLRAASGNRSDYIDHGNPKDEEERKAYAEMVQYTSMANEQIGVLKSQVDFLRQFCPKILAEWADLHIKTCERIRAEYDENDIDGKVSVYVAHETIEAWKAFLAGGETFVTINEYWLGEYSRVLDELIAKMVNQSD